MRIFLPLVDENQLSLTEQAPITSLLEDNQKTERKENKEKALSLALIPNSPTKINDFPPPSSSPAFWHQKETKTVIR